MTGQSASVVLLYDATAYVETPQVSKRRGSDAPLGLVGRQVAGREFLDAYLTHGDWSELNAVVFNKANADSLRRFFQGHAANRGRNRRLRVETLEHFMLAGGNAPPTATVLHTPCPTDPSFAWARRQHRSGQFALSGVTHTLCTSEAIRVLNEYLTAPFEPYDALICTSSSVSRMVRSVTDSYAAYLQDRFGGSPTFAPRLETIPLGVNPDRFRPPIDEERWIQRKALNIADDAIAVLFVGRFTPHAKAHPFPVFQGLAKAAEAAGQRVHLILSGWAPSNDILQAYLNGLRTFAPNVPVSVVNGVDPKFRFGVWHAADVLCSFSDSIQETFGLVIVEAMASGLPVVASDWDGYRDLVVDGTTGFLVPTAMVQDATTDATMRLLLGIVDYDGFLAECNQAAIVDPAAAAEALARLLRDAELRQRMGQAARQRVLERFTWEGVVRAYETLWSSQEEERQAFISQKIGSPSESRSAASLGPPCYLAPEVTFGGYPTRILSDDARLKAVPDAAAHLTRVLALPLCNYAGERRVQDEAVLQALLTSAASGATLRELADALQAHGASPGKCRAALAWLLKYGVLRVV